MTITASTSWRAGLAIPYATWQAVITQAGGPADLASKTAYDAAGNLSGLCLAQLGEESAYGTRYAANVAANMNPLNMRPRNGGAGFLRLSSVVNCIAEWRDRVLSPDYVYRDAETIAELVNIYAPPSDGNNSTQYAINVVTRLNRWGAQAGGSPVAVYPVVGLPGPGIELPVPLSHDIISTAQTNQRPGIALTKPYYFVMHETANEAVGADAAMHDRWLHGGADGSQLSFHFCVDDGAIYQMIPINEVTWQAADGAGPGNMNGISCELCVNADGNEAVARHNAEALAGGIMRALGLPIDRLKAHYDFNQADPNRHHCPDHMLNEGYWPTTFKANVAKIIAGGSNVADPFPITWTKGDVGPHKIGDSTALALVGQVKAKRTVPLHQGADAKSPKVGEIKAGATATIVGTFHAKAGRKWVFVEFGDGKYGRALASAFAPTFPTL